MTEERRLAIEREREKITEFVDNLIDYAIEYGMWKKTVNMGYESFTDSANETERIVNRCRRQLLNYIDLILEN